MRVLLVDPPGWQKHSVNLGLCYLAGTLASENIEVKILDLNNHAYSEDSLKRIIKTFDPGIIGFSAKTATANATAKLAGQLKSFFPDIVFVAGGPHLSLCAKEFLKEHRVFDFGIVGDGEIPFLLLVRYLTNPKTSRDALSGSCWYQGDVFCSNPSPASEEIARLNFPKFEAIIDFNFHDLRYPLLTSRGCPYGCIFCCVGAISGKKWRPREPEDVVGELIEAKRKYQITSFEIMDDNFTLDLNRAKTICRLLILEKLSLNWWCHNGLRADRLDGDLLRLMKKAGCKSIAIGIETGDEKVFNEINKGESLGDITRAVAMIQKSGMECVGYFIIGLPGDSVESTKKTVRFQRSLKLSGHTYNMAIPYPGTKFSEFVHHHGRLLLDIRDTCHFGDHAKVPFETNQLDKETLERCYHLATHQDWVCGEQDLQRIKETFQAKFQSDVKRIVFIADRGSEGMSKNLLLEYPGADVIEIRLDNDRCPSALMPLSGDEALSAYDSVLKLSRRGERIIINIPQRKLLAQDEPNVKEEHVRDEVLPDICTWDKPEGRYYATRLKRLSLSSRMADNGLIYKDGIALPFSIAPQWEKIPCGKIESGLAFVSRASYDPQSVYAADYVSTNLDSLTREIMVEEEAAQNSLFDGSFFERFLSQSDLLFIPVSLAGFAHVFSKAKMNAVFYEKSQGIKYEILQEKAVWRDPFLKMAAEKIFRKVGASARALGRSRSFAGKVFKVMGLWAQIAAWVFWTKFKGWVTSIVRISE